MSELKPFTPGHASSNLDILGVIWKVFQFGLTIRLSKISCSNLECPWLTWCIWTFSVIDSCENKNMFQFGLLKILERYEPIWTLHWKQVFPGKIYSQFGIKPHVSTRVFQFGHLWLQDFYSQFGLFKPGNKNQFGLFSSWRENYSQFGI